ncbi:MAG: hypothetical protein KKD73_01770 [Proteobacteria bacterium]|nr:hypothetical protein [Pseudomonadota bacterium]MBU1640099.1 hypothetical protein [Pseudomonadota bacterium]
MSDIITRTHQFWSSAFHIIGKGSLAKTYSVSTRQVERWSADPDFCECISRNPLDLLSVVCRRLLEVGRRDVVEGGLRRLVEPLGYCLRRNKVVSDKESIAHELIDLDCAKGLLAKTYLEAIKDDEISEDERAALLSRADDMIRDLEEVKDAIRRSGEDARG